MKHSSFQPSQPAPLQAEPHSGFQETQQFSRDQSIGDIIRQANNLSPEQIEQILAYQREKGVRFGEAAVALGLANSDDVLWALAQQFHYPYANEGRTNLNAELIVATRPFSEQAEAFRSIRSHLIMKMYSDEGPRHALAVVSPENGDGKTFFAANLAVAFSQLPGRTLLIDADMRSPRLHELFNMEYRGGGLSAVLSGRAATNVIQSVRDLNNLFILPVGGTPPNPLELLERPAFELLIRELRTKFDRIIVDTPAASSGADSAVVAAKCGASLLLARRNHSSVDAMQNLLATVSMGSTRIVGTILNEY
ncbi:polysaccharide biosynthesis tyrosine autokinase [Aquabacterium sp.]|uniref:polysaccharide biosynthesis tyrosine autokinase n=1 Tax=Aquabacterium sp. TaxID=1872578 RepID=UPI0027B8BCF7|nr:polysaccharide biosynthesis tyrosine autokinase [Aquabacterium sp.]